MNLTNSADEGLKWVESSCPDTGNPRIKRLFRRVRIDCKKGSEELKVAGLERASNELNRRNENSTSEKAARHCYPWDFKIEDSNFDDMLNQHFSMGCPEVAVGLPTFRGLSPTICNGREVWPADRTEDPLGMEGSSISRVKHLNARSENGLQIDSKSESAVFEGSDGNFAWPTSCPESQTLWDSKDAMEVLHGIDVNQGLSNGGYMKIWSQARADAKNRKGRERSLRTRMRNAERLRALEIGCSLLSEENARIKEIIRELVFCLPVSEALEIDRLSVNPFSRIAGVCAHDEAQDWASYLNEICSHRSNTTSN
jgi:hypothetical protein